VYLREKEANDYNGLEHHVIKCIENKDNSWFPINRAMCINENDNLSKDDIETRERREILQKLNELQEELMEMRNNMGNLSASVNTSLSSETSDDKFASVVDSVMKKSRVSKILQMYMTSKKNQK
jgi:hypothetical protein